MAGLRQRDLTRYADTVIVGGGSAGAARAGVFAERSEQSVVLLEAGPDYGPLTRELNEWRCSTWFRWI